MSSELSKRRPCMQPQLALLEVLAVFEVVALAWMQAHGRDSKALEG